MKRLHVNVNVQDLDRSIQFYTTLFAAPPSVVKDDYAKWMLDDPRVNFAISTRSQTIGVDHLGIQTDTAEDLHAFQSRLKDAEAPLLEQGETTCCYARSDKAWTFDP